MSFTGDGPFRDDEIIPMSMTCSKCGTVANNDKVEHRHPLDFINTLRGLGWRIPLTQLGSPPPSGGIEPIKCPQCSSK